MSDKCVGPPTYAPVPERRVADLITAVADGLTASERSVADFVDDDPTALAFGTVASVARGAGVSGPTVMRFATKLGFDGFTALQAHARRALSERLIRPGDRQRHASAAVDTATSDATWSRWRDQMLTGVADVFEHTDPRHVQSFAAAIADAPGHVWILSSATASAAAHVLGDGLALLRPGVHVVGGPGSTSASPTAHLLDADHRDVVVAIDMPRYERRVVDAAGWLTDHGAVVLAITDGPLSPLATLADHWCQVRPGTIGPFDDALGAVALAQVVLAAVADRLGERASARLDDAESLWELDGVFHGG